MSDDPCVDGCGEDAATIERLRERLARLTQALHEWGALSTAGDIVSAEDFAEAIEENGAWRLARDLRAALTPQNRPRSAVDAPEAPGQPGRDEDAAGGRVEALADILRQHEDQTDRSAIDGCSCGYSDPRTFPEHLAEAILTDPGPLLAALPDVAIEAEALRRFYRARYMTGLGD